MSVASVLERLSPVGVRQRTSRSTPAIPAKAASPAATRLDWVDMARAGAVVAVVLFHACIGHYWAMEHAKGDAIAWWDRVNQIVTAVRMPLLFTISGMLAAGKIRRGFRRGRPSRPP